MARVTVLVSTEEKQDKYRHLGWGGGLTGSCMTLRKSGFHRYTVSAYTDSEWKRNESRIRVPKILPPETLFRFQRLFWKLDPKTEAVNMTSKYVPGLNWLSIKPLRRIGEWRYSSTILNFGTRSRWMYSFTSLLFYRWYPPYEARWVQPQSRPRCCVYQESNTDPSAVQPVAQSLFWLSYQTWWIYNNIIKGR
jgi:hypothetical protein